MHMAVALTCRLLQFAARLPHNFPSILVVDHQLETINPLEGQATIFYGPSQCKVKPRRVCARR